MKYSILAIGSLVVASANANEGIDHLLGKTDIIRSRDVTMNQNGDRVQCIPLEGSQGASGEGNPCRFVEVPDVACDRTKCDDESIADEDKPACCQRRLLGRRTNEVVRAKDAVTTTPFPKQDDTVSKTGKVIAEIREDTSDVEGDIACFYFVNEQEHVYPICDYIDYDSANQIASIKDINLPVGEWTWWATTTAGVETTNQTFTLTADPGTDASNERSAGGIVRQSGGVNTVVAEEDWNYGGQIQDASGRIYYNSYGVDYACSGTVIKDNKSGRSLIMTAAHCVFDDIDWVWGSKAIFIPNRDGHDYDLTGDEIHRMCTEDVCGCWDLSAGFVPAGWRDLGWPARLEYDYGFWVVDDQGSHQGPSCGSDALDEAVDEVEFTVGVDLTDEYVTGLGYSLDHNPELRYCADHITFNQPTSGTDTYWLDSCGLTGGASGGPWIVDMDTSTGIGKIASVNSWSYSDGEGMGGPIIDASEARCLVNAARDSDFTVVEAEADGSQGVFVDCVDRECITAEELAASPRLRRGRRLKVCDHDNEKTHVLSSNRF